MFSQISIYLFKHTFDLVTLRDRGSPLHSEVESLCVCVCGCGFLPAVCMAYACISQEGASSRIPPPPPHPPLAPSCLLVVCAGVPASKDAKPPAAMWKCTPGWSISDSCSLVLSLRPSASPAAPDASPSASKRLPPSSSSSSSSCCCCCSYIPAPLP
ncbi:hypothetical protein FN846DRAFT_978713 [Sphaerosporella brunnea]|uniref:Uncharacterized protein n=1 Tax=Sphaerosporella brunnea TaxID=1250544 RepID=A0A5J5EEU0_9PEZI|nr:hypothetical protein FN846DRAFT_978713 [Sphaerosporella brunnea]